MIGIKVNTDNKYAYVTMNYRHIIQNNWLDDLQYICEPTEYHEKRVTVRFTTSNGIMREFTRHRSHSFAVESTRYCNYTKNKFDSNVTFIIPSWVSIQEGMYEQYDELSYSIFLDNYTEIEMKMIPDSQDSPDADNLQDNFIQALFEAEYKYMRLVKSGCKPQEAREVLPLATKCDMVMTGFVSDWKHFFRLRTSIIAETGKPHPDASTLADPLYEEFIARNYMEPLI